MDFPWVGEACDTSNDTCWEVEYLSWCEATGDPAQPETAGVCVLPCDDVMLCMDRDGTAPLFCADIEEGTCLGQESSLNSWCADVPGTVVEALPSWDGSVTLDACVPYAW